MVKKKDNSLPKPNSQSLLDRLIEQSFTLILTFVFATALIGGSTYLLFQFSNDFHSVNRELLEQEVRANQLRNFLGVMEVFSDGWILNKSEQSRHGEIVQKVTSAHLVENLDSAFIIASSSWIDGALETISSDKGKISGYQLVGEVEQDLQRNIIEEHDFWLNYLKVTDDLLKNWNTDTPSKRSHKIESISELLLTNFSNIPEMTSNLAQIKSQYKLEIRFLEQDINELNAKKFTLWAKFSLSVIGIIVGLAVFIYISNLSLEFKT